MTASVTVRHNFETGHRLPHLPGKCQSLHGHSWWTDITVTAPDHPDLVVEFGPFKAAVRSWIDSRLDHGVMLGEADQLVDYLGTQGTKLYVFRGDDAWPTVENTAALLARVAEEELRQLPRAADAHVSRVRVQETHVNAAEWVRD